MVVLHIIPYVKRKATMVDNAKNDKMGRIEVVFGPMFSGKSTELIRRIRRHTVAEEACLVVKYQKDLRYSSDKIATHDKQTWESAPCMKLEDVRAQAADATVIGIDEGQFFPDLISFCEDMANAGKIVIVACLDGTFQRKAFGDVLQLVPLAESVVKLSAVCSKCHSDAAFSHRLTDDVSTEVIGGSESYEALCRGCYAVSSHPGCV